MFIQYNDGVKVHDSTSTQVWGSEDSDCADDKEKAENAGKCPSSCQRDIDCLIASCSDCAVVDVVCDEKIDTAAYPQLAGQATDEDGNNRTYSDLDLADVPAEKKLQAPYGDSGLFDTMNLWGPEGCRYPYYGYLPDAPLCNECSSLAEAKEDVLKGLWDGPCNSEDPPTWDDDEGPYTEYTPPTPANYPGCGCDCADFLRRDISAQCTPTSCIHVAQQYAPANSVCAGSDVKWDTVSGCTDEYGTGTQFDSTWSGDACLDSTGATTVVQDASATCYQTQASISEADLVDYKANPKQCAAKPISAAAATATGPVAAAAATGPAISAVLALVGAVALGP